MKRKSRVHIIHVGSVQNKGTYALLRSEISEIRRTCENNVEISVSTDDVEALENLEPNLKVYPGLIDIPFSRTDIALRRGRRRRTFLSYGMWIMRHTCLMMLQAFLATASALSMSIGVKPRYRTETLLRIRECDLVISTADESFKEGSVYMRLNVYWMLNWWTILFSRMVEILIVKRLLAKPLIVFPNSIGPFQTRVGLLLARIIFANVDLVMLREVHSYGLFKKLDVKTPSMLTTDVALLFRCPGSKVGRSLPPRAVGVCPALYALSFSADEVRGYIASHAAVLDYLVGECKHNVVFLPHEVSPVKPQDDLQISRAIVGEMKHANNTRIIETSSVDEFKSLLSQLDFLITSRMHPAVLACAANVPTLMLVYDHKQTGFFAQLGLTDYMLPVRDITRDTLLKKVSLLLGNMDKVKTELRLRVPVLQDDLRTSIRKAMVYANQSVMQS